MPRIMTLPKIGVNMTEAVVDEWFVKPGDVVKEGDAIFLAETDKATQEIFATDSGIVGKLLAQKGDTVEIHQPILVLLDEGELLGDETAAKQAVEAKQAPEQAAKEEKIIIAKAQTPPAAISTGSRVRISPLAKKLAKEKGLNIAMLSPAIPGKRITQSDVLSYGNSAPANTARVSAPTPTALRALATLEIKANANQFAELTNNLNVKGLAVRATDIIAKACAVALKQHNRVNGGNAQINIGIETDVSRAVVADTDRKTVGQINAEFDLADTSHVATFAIVDLGALDIARYIPGVASFNCATLAVGSITKDYTADENGQPKLSRAIRMTLAFDGAAISGIEAAKFLSALKDFIENPMLLLMM